MDYVLPTEVVSDAVNAAVKKAGLAASDMLLRGALAGAFLGYATSLVQMFTPATVGGQGFISPDLSTDPVTKSGYIVTLAVGGTNTVVLAQANTCNMVADALASYFGIADPVTFGGTGTRHFGTDERGTIFQDTTDNVLALPLATAGTVAPVQ